MERASQLLLDSKLGSKVGGARSVAQGAWRSAVGARLARLTHAASLEGGILTVYVDDPVWVSQFEVLKPQILTKMRKLTSKQLVNDLRFRIMPGRRGPALATEPVRDRETEAIEDPLLRRIFRRKQA
jgi:predicted nucleic acid-binding Zn ribbon protein